MTAVSGSKDTQYGSRNTERIQGRARLAGPALRTRHAQMEMDRDPFLPRLCIGRDGLQSPDPPDLHGQRDRLDRRRSQHPAFRGSPIVRNVHGRIEPLESYAAPAGAGPSPRTRSTSSSFTTTPISPAKPKKGQPKPDPADPIYRQTLISGFIDNITVSSQDRTRIVDVSFRSRSPKLAADVLNALIDGYIELIVSKRFAASEQATEFLNAQVNELRTDIAEREQKAQRVRFAEGYPALVHSRSAHRREDRGRQPGVDGSDARKDQQAQYLQSAQVRPIRRDTERSGEQHFPASDGSNTSR